jgi:parvulin-like peptidyl-prolyl isomerase
MKYHLPHSWQHIAFSLALGTLLLVGCSSDSAQSASNLITGGTVTPSPVLVIIVGSPSPEIVMIVGTPTLQIINTMPTPTPEAPTATVKPENADLAARVNHQDITLEQFNAEMARYLAADPSSPSPDSVDGKQLASQLKDTVLDTLIDRILLVQEAQRLKLTVADAQVDDELNSLIQARGGRDQFNAWLAANKQSEQDVRDAIRNEFLASLLRDRIVEQLPRTAEYVHAYHILVATEAQAQNVLAKLRNGSRFTALVQSLSIDDSTRPNGGDLGWFARGTGTILWPEVEDAAFALKPGQLSPIIHSPVGFHIVKVVERQTRALTPDDMAYVQQAALDQWISRLKANAVIEKFI